MARYDFKCRAGHVTEGVFPMATVPDIIRCAQCPKSARRVLNAPAAIHYKAGGFYTTDVKQKLHRKRRPNPGDDLPKEFDDGAARIADAI